MRLSKITVSLICLSCMMLGVDSSSKINILDNSNLSSMKNINNSHSIKSINIQKVSKDKDKKSIEAEKLKIQYAEKVKSEKQRKLKVTYNRDDMTLVSGITEEELKNVFRNYKGASTMSHLSKAFVDAEKEHGVNAFTMAAIVALESGFATSRRAVEDNNLTGYEVYSKDSKGKLFKTQSESILQTAKHLSKNYLTENGLYYRGVSVDDVQLSYCPDEGEGKNWNGKVDKLASDFLRTYKNLYAL